MGTIETFYCVTTCIILTFCLSFSLSLSHFTKRESWSWMSFGAASFWQVRVFQIIFFCYKLHVKKIKLVKFRIEGYFLFSYFFHFLFSYIYLFILWDYGKFLSIWGFLVMGHLLFNTYFLLSFPAVNLFIYLGFYVAFNTVQVISGRLVGRAEETSTYSWSRFCTVSCWPTASNYQLSHFRSGLEANSNLRGGRRECYHSVTMPPPPM